MTTRQPGHRIAPLVPELVTNRLSVYLRCLNEAAREGVCTISSTVLARRFDVNAALFRKDLSYFGGFGVRGVGYDVETLRQRLRAILGLDRRHRVVIVGAGNLGLALADFAGFSADGFDIVALADSAPEKIGARTRGGIPVTDAARLTAIVVAEQLDIGVVAVPPAAAQSVVDQLVEAGICAILNFSPVPVRVPEHVQVRSVDLSLELEGLSFFLTDRHGTNTTP